MIACRINGHAHQLDVHPMKRLLDVLREDCALTGTKEGCGEGECGACTVLIDGVAVNSCLVPVVQVEGAEVLTIEGLAKGQRPHPLQEAFVTHVGAQCGICTPGMIMAALGVKRRAKAKDIQSALAGNLCRCTGYVAIYRAVKEGAGRAGKAVRAGKAGKADKAGRAGKAGGSGR
jgi:aerobic-type carbon monoxide dehydrogenase small subunit (CoxS/CutS family)